MSSRRWQLITRLFQPKEGTLTEFENGDLEWLPVKRGDIQ